MYRVRLIPSLRRHRETLKSLDRCETVKISKTVSQKLSFSHSRQHFLLIISKTQALYTVSIQHQSKEATATTKGSNIITMKIHLAEGVTMNTSKASRKIQGGTVHTVMKDRDGKEVYNDEFKIHDNDANAETNNDNVNMGIAVGGGELWIPVQCDAPPVTLSLSLSLSHQLVLSLYRQQRIHEQQRRRGPLYSYRCGSIIKLSVSHHNYGPTTHQQPSSHCTRQEQQLLQLSRRIFR